MPASSMYATIRCVLIFGCASAAASCAESIGPDVDPGESRSLVQVSAEEVASVPGFPLPDSVAVRVVDANGGPVVGAEVHFTVSGGSGSVSPGVVLSDGAGTAKTQWTLGPVPGDNSLEVTTVGGGSPVAFTARAAWGPEASVEVVSGASTPMPVGCPIDGPLVVRVTDSGGAPVGGAPVLFSVADMPATGRTVLTDASGLAGIDWRMTEAEERVIARIATADAAEVAFELRGVPIAPGGYAAVGNRIINADCAPHRFAGVARPGLQWWPDDSRLSDPDSATADFSRMRSWGANIVRIPVYQRLWLRDFSVEGFSSTAAEYRALVEGSVERANAEGLAVVIDLHASDRGDPDFPSTIFDIQQMADANHSLPFWTSVAETFRDNGGVIFQLYNEPNQIDWQTWRDGGPIPGGDTFPPQSSGVAFEAAGMQDMYDAVRAAGAENLVIVNGMHWGYDLSRVLEFAIDGYNIMYATHPYDYPDKQPERWEADWGYLADTYPVMIAEFGDYTCNSNGYYTSVLDYADSKQLSWIAWAWWAPPADQPELICGFPALIESWSGDPSPTGEVVRARMLGYGN